MNTVMNRNKGVSAADMIAELVSEKPQYRFQHIVRHYGRLLTMLEENPAAVPLHEYGEKELHDLMFYAARTGRMTAFRILSATRHGAVSDI